GQNAQRRHDRHTRLFALFGENRLVMRGAAAAHGDAVTTKNIDDAIGNKFVDQHDRKTAAELHDDINHTADMRKGKCQTADIALGWLRAITQRIATPYQ